MKAYTFRVFNKAVRRARASACPDDCDVDDLTDAKRSSSKLTPSLFLPTDAGGVPVQPRVAGHGAGTSQTAVEPSARCRTRLETFTTTHHPRNRAHLTRRLPPSAFRSSVSSPDRDAVE